MLVVVFLALDALWIPYVAISFVCFETILWPISKVSIDFDFRTFQSVNSLQFFKNCKEIQILYFKSLLVYLRTYLLQYRKISSLLSHSQKIFEIICPSTNQPKSKVVTRISKSKFKLQNSEFFWFIKSFFRWKKLRFQIFLINLTLQ